MNVRRMQHENPAYLEKERKRKSRSSHKMDDLISSHSRCLVSIEYRVSTFINIYVRIVLQTTRLSLSQKTTVLRATSQQATGLYKIHYNATHSYVPRSVTFLYSEPMQSTSVTIYTSLHFSTFLYIYTSPPLPFTSLHSNTSSSLSPLSSTLTLLSGKIKPRHHKS